MLRAAALLVLAGLAAPAAACDPAVYPAQEILARPELAFVIGRFTPDGRFTVTETLRGAIPPGSYRLEETGPFGNQCESATMAITSPNDGNAAPETLFLLPVEKMAGRTLGVTMGFGGRLSVNGLRVTDLFGQAASLPALRRALADPRSPAAIWEPAPQP